MKTSLFLCVLLGVVLSAARAASLNPYAKAFIWTTPATTLPGTTVTTAPNTSSPPATTPPNTSSPPATTPPNTSSPPATTSPTPPPATTTTNTPTQSQIMCHPGWQVFQGRCYYFVNEGMTWFQAQSTCAMLGSMLVSVHSAQEYGFLQQLTYNNENSNAWLGGFYLQDRWLWTDGSWFYNNSWAYESPDSSNPCLMLSAFEAWSNNPCNAGGSPAICVKNSNVPPEILCPYGWTGFLGRCYYFNYESLTWPEADTSCAVLDASLVSIHSPEEYAFIFQLTAENGVFQSWLGGFYLDDQWLWLDGSWFYQDFFAQSSPGSTSSCLSTFGPTGWSNFACDQSMPSFCVKNTAV